MRWSYDFESLPTPILDYEAIPQITEEEIDHYINFLKTPGGKVWIYYGLDEHQKYDLIRAAHVDDDGYMPEYYDYHYQTYGNTHLLLLTDKRKDEEKRLIRLVMNLNKKGAAERTKKTPAPKPSLSYHTDEAKIALAEFLGEKQVASFVKDLAKWVKEKLSFETDWAMDYLSKCYPDSVPMPAAPRWQDAIQNAALDHITLKMQEKLHGIYEEYLMKKQLGTSIGHVKGEDTYRNDMMLRMLEIGERLDHGETVDPDEIWKDLL